VAVEVSDEQGRAGTFRRILRELPRKKVALVLLLVFVNLGVVAWCRGRAIGLARYDDSDHWGGPSPPLHRSVGVDLGGVARDDVSGEAPLE
jgi:hypothetical protein